MKFDHTVIFTFIFSYLIKPLCNGFLTFNYYFAYLCLQILLSYYLMRQYLEIDQIKKDKIGSKIAKLAFPHPDVYRDSSNKYWDT